MEDKESFQEFTFRTETGEENIDEQILDENVRVFLPKEICNLNGNMIKLNLDIDFKKRRGTIFQDGFEAKFKAVSEILHSDLDLRRKSIIESDPTPKTSEFDSFKIPEKKPSLKDEIKALLKCLANTKKNSTYSQKKKCSNKDMKLSLLSSPKQESECSEKYVTMKQIEEVKSD